MPNLDFQTPGNSLNSDRESVSKNMHPYDLGRSYQTTERYGAIYPHFYHFGLESDEVHHSSACALMTLPMKTPNFTRVSHKSQYFFVPNSALLPINYEKVYKEPAFGSDIPAADVGMFGRHPLMIANAWRNFAVYVSSLSPTTDQQIFVSLFGSPISNLGSLVGNAVKMAFRLAVLSESLFASKTLLSSLGYPLNPFYCRVVTDTISSFPIKGPLVFETAFSDFVKYARNGISLFTVSGNSSVPYGIDEPLLDYDKYVTFSEFLDIIRYRPDYITCFCNSYPNTADGIVDALTYIKELYSLLVNPSSTSDGVGVAPLFPSLGVVVATPVDDAISFAEKDALRGFNYDPLLAYQMGVACMFNNDQTDFVLNPPLWLSVMQSMLLRMVSDDGTGNHDKLKIPTFSYNGASYCYDCVSGYNISHLIYCIENIGKSVGFDSAIYVYSNLDVSISAFMNILSFQPSLKYFDYFLGGRTRIYSVGDNLVSDTSNPAEIARALIYQKAKMIFSRIGNDYDDYTKEVLNSYNGMDQYHDVIPCGEGSYDVQTYNVENNTGDGQGNLITAVNMSGSLGSCDLTLQIRGTVIGVNFFTAERSYCRASESFYYKEDRLDHFNPLLQHTGDIALPLREIDSVRMLDSSLVYSYMIKDMDYKQTFNHVDGAFVDSLPSWSFLADAVGDPDFFATGETLTMYSIRELPSVFDRFFASLPYLSEGTRFHFIVSIFHDTNVVRNMIPKPQLLQ